jgi:ribosome maturation factor RimP
LDSSAVVRQAWEYLEPELVAIGYELIEVEYVLQGSSWVLRLFIDDEDGITLEDCTSVSRLVSALMEQDDFVSGPYSLEVSSPGIDRPIRRADDFKKYAGEAIKLKTVSPIEGRKRFRGTLKGIEDGIVSFEHEGELIGVHIENVKKAQLDR